jgi:hypothetical protein
MLLHRAAVRFLRVAAGGGMRFSRWSWPAATSATAAYGRCGCFRLPVTCQLLAAQPMGTQVGWLLRI